MSNLSASKAQGNQHEIRIALVVMYALNSSFSGSYKQRSYLVNRTEDRNTPSCFIVIVHKSTCLRKRCSHVVRRSKQMGGTCISGLCIRFSKAS